MEKTRLLDFDYWLEFARRKNLFQFVRFAMAGAFCASVEIYLFYWLVEEFGESNLYFFNSMAFSVAVLINYFLSRYWVFHRSRHSVQREFLTFVFMATVGLGLNYLAMNFFWEYLGIYHLYAKIIAIILVVAWNFTSKKYIVFRR